MTSDDNELLRADAKVDQESAALVDMALADVPAWAELNRKLRRLEPGDKFTDAEVMTIHRLAVFAGQIIIGRMLERSV